jgi:hypothetical protein
MSHGQIVEILDPAEDTSFHPARLFSQDGKSVIGVRSEDERIKLFSLELVRVRRLITVFQYGTFLGTRNETHNHTVEAECNVACLLDFVLPGFICVRKLGINERHTVGRH